MKIKKTKENSATEAKEKEVKKVDSAEKPATEPTFQMTVKSLERFHEGCNRLTEHMKSIQQGIKDEQKCPNQLDKETECIYICAFRYALRTQSFMSKVVIEQLRKVWTMMPKSILDSFVREIRISSKLGDIDIFWEKQWLKFASELNDFLRTTK